jgi:hypothetical protein
MICSTTITCILCYCVIIIYYIQVGVSFLDVGSIKCFSSSIWFDLHNNQYLSVLGMSKCLPRSIINGWLGTYTDFTNCCSRFAIIIIAVLYSNYYDLFHYNYMHIMLLCNYHLLHTGGCLFSRCILIYDIYELWQLIKKLLVHY